MGVLFVEYPRCSTCKKAKRWLDEHGVAYTDRHIVEQPPTASELACWRDAGSWPLRRLFNTSGTKYRELGIKAKLDAGMGDAEALGLLSSDGMLVKRPILVVSDDSGAVTGAFFGFREAAWTELLGLPTQE